MEIPYKLSEHEEKQLKHYTKSSVIWFWGTLYNGMWLFILLLILNPFINGNLWWGYFIDILTIIIICYKHEMIVTEVPKLQERKRLTTPLTWGMIRAGHPWLYVDLMELSEGMDWAKKYKAEIEEKMKLGECTEFFIIDSFEKRFDKEMSDRRREIEAYKHSIMTEEEYEIARFKREMQRTEGMGSAFARTSIEYHDKQMKRIREKKRYEEEKKKRNEYAQKYSKSSKPEKTPEEILKEDEERVKRVKKDIEKYNNDLHESFANAIFDYDKS